MVYATSDLHGYPMHALLDLLASVSFSEQDQLYIIGDVNDRNGDGGVAMYRWIMRQPNVTLIRGNHEQMLLDCDFLFTEDVDLAHLPRLSIRQEKALLRWNKNGCIVTIDNLLKLKGEDPEELNKLLDFLRETPIYLELTVNDKRFILVHGGLPEFCPEKKMEDYDPFELLWTRPEIDTRYWEDRVVVLGHTPTRHYGEKGKMYATDTWIDIDTGAGSGGHPMLLRLDDLEPFYVEEQE